MWEGDSVVSCREKEGVSVVHKKGGGKIISRTHGGEQAHAVGVLGQGARRVALVRVVEEGQQLLGLHSFMVCSCVWSVSQSIAHHVSQNYQPTPPTPPHPTLQSAASRCHSSWLGSKPQGLCPVVCSSTTAPSGALPRSSSIPPTLSERVSAE